MTVRLSLVTGGAGFIGRHLVRQLLDGGDRVRVLDIAEPVDMPSEVEVVRGSVLDADTVRQALRGVDRLYHLAANPNLWAPRRAEFVRTNLEGTRVVLAQAAGADLERIVHCSTESILKGRSRSSAEIEETVALRVEDMPGPYCRSKFLAEQEALAAAGRGLPVVVVNPTLPVGPGDRWMTPPTRMLQLFLNGGTPFYLDCRLNLIDVRDAALGHILAADKGRVGERYILGGENLDMSQLLGLLEDLSGLPMPRRRVPYWLALAVGMVSEFMADHVTHRSPLAPLTGVRLARSPMTFSSAKALAELGLSPRPIRAALASSIAWLASRGMISRRPARDVFFEDSAASG